MAALTLHIPIQSFNSCTLDVLIFTLQCERLGCECPPTGTANERCTCCYALRKGREQGCTCAGMAAVLIHQSACLAFSPKHLFQHDAALDPQNAEDTVQMHSVLQVWKQKTHSQLTTLSAIQGLQVLLLLQLKQA